MQYAAAKKPLGRVNGLLERLETGELKRCAKAIVGDLSRRLEDGSAACGTRFSEEFRQLCAEHELQPVRGDHIKGFQVKHLIKVRPRFDKDKTTISTAARKWRIPTIAPEKVVAEVQKAAEFIYGRDFSPPEFLECLFSAYTEAQSNVGEDALLTDVLKAYWEKLQSPEFWKTYNKDKVKDYSVDEFSVDIARLLRSGHRETEQGWQLQLKSGAGGLVVYSADGRFTSYKFIQFMKQGGRTNV